MKSLIIIFLSLLIANISVNCQIVVSGQVLSVEDNSPLPGASVIVKGATRGTITDLDGKFSIELQYSDSLLIFSYLGFETQENEVGNQTWIEVNLIPSQPELQEIIVIAYGTVSKSTVTGSISKIDALDISYDKKPSKTWKRSGKPENEIALFVDEEEQIPLKSRQIAVKIDGFRARVLMDCYFFNNAGGNYEGTFKLKLPNGASPYFFAFGGNAEYDLDDSIPIVDYNKLGFQLFSDDQILNQRINDNCKLRKAIVVPSAQAAFAYESTVEQNIDPALAEWGGADVFNCRVFPLQDNALCHIVVGYDLDLTQIGDDFVYQLIANSKDINQTIDIEVSKLRDKKVVFETKAKITENAENYYLHIESNSNTEIEIRYVNPGATLLLSDNKENSYFAANFIVPDLSEGKEVKISSDAIFVIDASISSNPDKFNTWIKIVTAILKNNQDVIKRFNVLIFNIDTHWWKNTYMKNTSANQVEMLKYLNSIVLQGATNLYLALKEASTPEWTSINKAKNIFLLSDGDANWGNENFLNTKDIINSNDRVYAFSTGYSGTNINLLQQLTRNSGGSIYSLTGEDEIPQASIAFRQISYKIESVKIDGVNDIIIAGRPLFLYPGQKLIIAGRGTPKLSSALKLNLKQGNKKVKTELPFSNIIDSKLTNRIYGQIATNLIEEFSYTTTNQSEKYSCYFVVPGKTCSFVMLETEEDYKEYSITSLVDEKYIKNNLVNEIIDSALTALEEKPNDEKQNFLLMIEKIRSVEELGFSMPTDLYLKLRELPIECFDIEVPDISGNLIYTSQVSDSIIKCLYSETIDYDSIALEAHRLAGENKKSDALKIFSSLLEQNPGNPTMLLDVAISAMEWKNFDIAYYLIKKAIEKRPFEPTMYLSMAKILEALGKYDLSLVFYEIILNSRWEETDDIHELKNIVKFDYLRFLSKTKRSQYQLKLDYNCGKRYKELFKNEEFAENLEDVNIKNFKCDLAVFVQWSTNETDMDLHVTEPTGEDCYYGNETTKIGGVYFEDVTDGYGPEFYCIPNAAKGKYKIAIDYYGNNSASKSARTKVYVTIIKNFGKINEVMINKVVFLKEVKGMQTAYEIEI